MAITNLANTKWQFGNEPALADAGTFAVNFTSNNTDYTSLTIAADKIKYGNDLAYGDPYPQKGNLITMNVDGSDKQFRVLNINDTVAEVVMMSNASDSQIFASSGRTYAGSALDTHLNSTWYATLNAIAKAAIVDKTFTQDSWYGDASGNPDYEANFETGATAYQLSLGNAAFGSSITRHVYALSIQDLIDYLEATPSMTQANTTITMANVLMMFFNSSAAQGGATNNIWLRSADVSVSFAAFGVMGSQGRVYSYGGSNSIAVRPAFTIDLSKIPFSISA